METESVQAAAATTGDAGTGRSGMPPVRDASARMGERVSTILADRVCTGCTFNLAGQPVYRERHYGMLIAVCPECGTAASVQEYPHLGKWTRRALAFLAGVWFVVLLGAMLVSSAALFGMAQQLTMSISEPLAYEYAKAHSEYHKQQAELGPPSQTTAWYATQPPSAYSPIDPAFVPLADWPAIREAAKLWDEALRFRRVFRYGVATLAMMAIGVAWAIVLPHARLGKRLLLVPFVCVGTALFLWIAHSNYSAAPMGWGWTGASNLAMADLSWPWSFMIAAALLPGLIIGLLVGRGVARAMVRFLLPPRLREPFVFLWLSDGKQPPIAMGTPGR